MKSQTDWIVFIASLVLALIVVGVCYATQPPIRTIPEPEKVITTQPSYPAGAVTFANSLPNAGSGGGGGGSAPAGMGGGAPGAGGPGGFGSAPGGFGGAPGAGGPGGRPSGAQYGPPSGQPGGPGGAAPMPPTAGAWVTPSKF